MFIETENCYNLELSALKEKLYYNNYVLVHERQTKHKILFKYVKLFACYCSNHYNRSLSTLYPRWCGWLWL